MAFAIWQDIVSLLLRLNSTDRCVVLILISSLHSPLSPLDQDTTSLTTMYTTLFETIPNWLELKKSNSEINCFLQNKSFLSFSLLLVDLLCSEMMLSSCIKQQHFKMLNYKQTKENNRARQTVRVCQAVRQICDEERKRSVDLMRKWRRRQLGRITCVQSLIGSSNLFGRRRGRDPSGYRRLQGKGDEPMRTMRGWRSLGGGVLKRPGHRRQQGT